MQSIEWRPVVGYEGRYEVSSTGRVRSIDRTITYSNGRVRRYPGVHLRLIMVKGYPRVNLCRAESMKLTAVHSLVTAAFIGPRPPELQVCHWDGNPENNNLGNLRYGTPVENMQDRTRHGNHAESRKTACRYNHEYTPENTYLHKGKRACRTCRLHALRAWRAGMTLAEYTLSMAAPCAPHDES